LSDIVVVGTFSQIKDAGVAVVVSVHEPLHVSGAVEDAEDEGAELVAVGKGKVPLPDITIKDDEDAAEDTDLVALVAVTVESGFNAEDDEIDDPVLVAFKRDALVVTESELLELKVCDPVADESEPVMLLDVFERVAVEVELAMLEVAAALLTFEVVEKVELVIRVPVLIVPFPFPFPVPVPVPIAIPLVELFGPRGYTGPSRWRRPRRAIRTGGFWSYTVLSCASPVAHAFCSR
jgi:hypothetical protein